MCLGRSVNHVAGLDQPSAAPVRGASTPTTESPDRQGGGEAVIMPAFISDS